MSFQQSLQKKLEQQQLNKLYRQRKTVSSPQQPEIVVDGNPLINFCSNDYLGLANNPEVLQATEQGLRKYGTGSGASHLVSGHSQAHHELEEALAEFTGRDRALLFSSGYMANYGVLTTLANAGDQVLEDRLNHASLIDGGLHSGARFARYQHLDMQSLKTKLQATDAGQNFIVTDGVFSMDGDIAPLPQLIKQSEQSNAVLMIDDAHGFGCLGKNGGGTIQHFQEQGHHITQDNCQIVVGTFGKAFGTSGAFVAGSELLIESLIQFCRPYIYTTALPAMMSVATLKSLDLVKQEQWRRDRLQEMIQEFRRHAQSLGFQLTDSCTPVQGLVLGDENIALRASSILAEQGLFVSAIRPPTVPKGASCLRLTFSASHTKEHFQSLLSATEYLAQELKL